MKVGIMLTACKHQNNKVSPSLSRRPPHTDLWQRTYYHFQNDNASVQRMKTRKTFFSFVANENDKSQHLGSVVTNKGYSDWATTAIQADVRTMWCRFLCGRPTTASNQTTNNAL